jgi:hypothetical protein
MPTEHSAKSAYFTDEVVELGAHASVVGRGGGSTTGSTTGGGGLVLNSLSSRSSNIRSRLVISAFVLNDEMSTAFRLVISIGHLFFKA